jgi:hypothetical protein
MSALRIKPLFLLAGVVLNAAVLLAWTQQWFTVDLAGDGPAQPAIAVAGDTAAPALAALSLAGLAALAALTLAGAFFRRVLGVLQVLLGGSIVLSAAAAVADPVGASAELVTKATGVSGAESIDRLVGSVAQTPWPFVTLALGLLIAALGVALIAIGSRWPHAPRRFQSAKSQPPAATGAAASDWDSLSGGSDPTSR